MFDIVDNFCRPLRGLFKDFGTYRPGVPLTLHPRLYALAPSRGHRIPSTYESISCFLLLSEASLLLPKSVLAGREPSSLRKFYLAYRAGGVQ